VGDSATFDVVADGLRPLFYQWQIDGNDIPGASSDTYTTPATTLSENGSAFQCIVTNAEGSVISEPARLKIIEATEGAPVIAVQPMHKIVFEGQSATFRVVAAGAGFANAEKVKKIRISLGQAEGICWSEDELIITNEKGEIYKITNLQFP
jgi:hypothetical protein